MNFFINQIILWSDTEIIRDLRFLPNKVNILTGNSSTGKSTLLRIIDYCFCKSSKPSKIPEEVINENTHWYGINFTVNDSTYTIARGKVIDGSLSSEFYLSISGEVPEMPSNNISETELKKRIETEFSIDSNLVIPYGGKTLKAGSKISFRYFLLFNTQSDRVINDEEQFFDKINASRYKEALDRIFGLAIGATNAEGVIFAEEIAKLSKELIAVERREELFSKQRGVFQNHIIDLISKAQTAGIIESGLPSVSDGVNILNELVKNYTLSYRREALNEAADLQRRRRDIVRRIKNIDSFDYNYKEYRNLISANADSLLPIDFLKENIPSILLVPAIAGIFRSLEERLTKLKRELQDRNPFIVNLSDERNALEQSLNEADESLRLYPAKSNDFADEAQRLILIGEIKAKLELYTQVSDDLDFSSQKEALADSIAELEIKARSLTDGKQIAIDILQEQIQKYIDSSTSLGVYQKYKAFFNEREKTLQLRPPGKIFTSDIGSSSNHLFMHLCLFLGLHDFFLQRKSKHIPQFLILDQLSRPYYDEVRKKNPEIKSDDEIGDELFESDDRKKLKEAFLMLDSFITYSVTELKQNFQFIVLEHVSPEFCSEIGMVNFHLVDDFRNGNALILSSKLTDN
jgi:Protein of unknown function (DUF3732)